MWNFDCLIVLTKNSVLIKSFLTQNRHWDLWAQSVATRHILYCLHVWYSAESGCWACNFERVSVDNLAQFAAFWEMLMNHALKKPARCERHYYKGEGACHFSYLLLIVVPSSDSFLASYPLFLGA